MTAAFASSAFRLALRGRAVFPLAVGSKVPLPGSHGFLEANSDPDVARARWNKWPGANIGVATGPVSGFWVLDIDAPTGIETMRALVRIHGKPGPTVLVFTPNGGLHPWFKWPEFGPEIRNSAGRVGPGLDVRGEGGYITAPPSVLLDRKRAYRWAPGRDEILPAPDWLVELTKPPPELPRQEPRPLTGDADNYVAAAVASEVRLLERAGEGTRNDTLNRVAFSVGGFVKAGCIPEEWARAQLESRAVATGLTLTEARRTIASAFAAARPREVTS
jgi:putative DNA primase/helicase